MNGTLLEPVRWSVRRWGYTLAAVFGLQVGLVFFLGQRPPALPVAPRHATRIVPANDPATAMQVARLPLLQDPVLFVLPHPQSFSGRAWLRFAPLEHPLSEWTEAPQWLRFQDQSLGDSFAWYAKSVTNAPLQIADLPPPPLPGADLPVPNQPVGRMAAVAVAGPLSLRPLEAPIALPAWPHPEGLTNTVVQLAVNALGQPVATTLLAECGLPAADRFALQQAATARFAPLRRPREASAPDLRLTWGTLVFQWVTVPPTNATPPGRAP